MIPADRMSSRGASVRSMRRVVAGTVALLALALIIISALEDLEGHQMETLIGYSEDNASWAVHQLETEQQRLEIALLHARDGLPADLAAAALRYETFASRRDVLATGVFHRKLQALPAYPILMQAFDDLLAANDPFMADGLQPPEVERLL